MARIGANRGSNKERFKSPKITGMTSQKMKKVELDARRQQAAPTHVALTLAGSDCSGGAGLEADLKTFHAHHVYGMAAVTCVVAENPRHVVSIHPVPARRVREQIACCLQGMKRVAVKTGMLYSEPIIGACSLEISNLQSQISNLIIDPVMVATSGKRLLQPKAIRALKNLIEAHADLVTPNLDEAEILAERTIRTESHMVAGAAIIAERFCCAVLLKGGHLKNLREAADFFWNGRDGFWLKSPRIRGVKTHGTGCTYSAAITAHLARGLPLEESVRRAKRFITKAIRDSHRFTSWMALNHNA